MPDWDDEGYYQTSFGVEKSRRYHEKMQAFYQSWYDYTNTANAVCGLTAFLALFGGKNSTLAQVFVGIVTVLSTIASKLGPAKKAKLHADLQRRFTDLSAEVAKRDATSVNLKWVSAQRLKIERDEPPVRRLVDHQARNEEARARGKPESDMIPLTWMQRRIGFVFGEYDMKRIETWKADRERAQAEAISDGTADADAS